MFKIIKNAVLVFDTETTGLPINQYAPIIKLLIGRI